MKGASGESASGGAGGAGGPGGPCRGPPVRARVISALMVFPVLVLFSLSGTVTAVRACSVTAWLCLGLRESAETPAPVAFQIAV